MNKIVFIDSEINHGGEICDLGAVKPEGGRLHTTLQNEFSAFASGCRYVCGHNLIAHDLKYVGRLILGDYTPIPAVPEEALSPPAQGLQNTDRAAQRPRQRRSAVHGAFL